MPSSVSGAPIQQAVNSITVNLTDAEIKALPTTGIEIVPAPGAGKTIVFIAAGITLDKSAGGYGNLTAGGYLWFTNAGNAVISTFIDISSLQTTDPYFFPFQPGQYFDETAFADFSVSVLLSQIENAAIVLKAENPGGNLTGGNAANSAKVTVLYTEIDI